MVMMMVLLKQISLVLFLEITKSTHSSQFTAVNTDVGRDVTLPCFSDDYSESSWEGPCLTTTECFFNKITYFDGLERNQRLPNTVFLQHDNQRINGTYSLHISSISLANEGVYTCLGLQNGIISDTKFTVWLREQHSNIIIRNLTSEGTIQGTEDVPLQLECELNSGLSEDPITLYKGFTQLKTGGPGILTYLFTPTPQDNGLIISCLGQSKSLNGSLNKQAVLDIKYQPIVHFIKENQLITEGNEFVIQCLSEGNPPVISTNINKGGQTLNFCKKPVCSLRLPGLRNESGAYSCTASNELGTRNSSTTVTVLHPPVVSVSMFGNKLHCSAVGVPNNATIVLWKHFSHRGTFLRRLEGSEDLTLSSMHPKYMLGGLYICEATNGIPNQHGKTISSGNYSVQISGIPEILQRTERVQFGRYNEVTTIQIFVHSIPPLVDTKIVRNETFVEKERPAIQTFHFIKENIFGKEVWIEGYTISFQIPLTTFEYFDNYTFILRNAKGSKSFTTILKMKDDTDVDHTSDEDIGKLFLTKYVIGTLVGSSLVSALFTGICVCIVCTRRKKSLKIQQNVMIENEPRYEEIYEMNDEVNNAIDILNPSEERNGQDSMNEQINESVEIDLEPRPSDISKNLETDTGMESLPSLLADSGELHDDTSDSEESSKNSSSRSNLRTSYQSLGERNSSGSLNTGYDQLVQGPFSICVSDMNNV